MSKKNIDSNKAPTSLKQLTLYALPTVGVNFLLVPMWSVLQGIYATYHGLALSTIATVILIGRLFDAITDPMIGYMSDRTRTYFGSRKPWVALGGLLFLLSSYFLYVPPENVSPTYFLLWFLAFFFSWTIFEIPHLAWGGELAANTAERNRIYALRYGFTQVGGLMFFVIPLLPFFPTSEITPETLKWSVLIMGLFLLPSIFVCVKKVDNGNFLTIYRPDRKSERHQKILISILRNKPLLLFLSSYAFCGIGAGMWIGLLYIYIDSYLNLGSQLSILFLVSVAIGAISVGVWYKFAMVFGKKNAWSGGVAFIGVGSLGITMIDPSGSPIIPLAILMSFTFVGYASLNAITPSLLSDIVDYGKWKFGTEQGATYFAAYTLITKANVGIGGAISLGIAGFYGFDAALSAFSSEMIFGLKLGIGYLPAVIIIAGLFNIGLVPIDARQHKIILRRLAERARRLEITST